MRTHPVGRRIGVLVACALGLLTPPAAGAEFEDFFLSLDGLVSHWGMSETSGNTVADSIVTDAIDGNNPGSFALGGGASLGAAGPRPSDGFAGMSAGNTAIDFSGVAGQRLDMNPAGYTGTGGLTSASLATWFRLTAPSTASRHNHIGGLQNEEDGAAGRSGLTMHNYPQTNPSGGASARGGLRAITRVGNAPQDEVTFNTAYTTAQGNASFWDSKWHFAVTTITPYGNQSRQLHLYVDGKLIDRTFTPPSSEAGATVGPTERLALRDALTFGEDSGDSSRLWVGQLDEIAMFSRNLTAGEVGAAWLAAKGITVNHAELPTRGVSAHRGASTTHPENTLAALREAVASGSHQVEFDVQLTADNKLVLMHDSTINRTTSGSGRVRDYTLAQLKALDAGSWKSPTFAGERIPTLEEALAVLPLNMWLNVEVKGVAGNDSATAQRVAEVLHQQGRLHQSFVSGGVDSLAGVANYESIAGIDIRTNNLDRQDGDTSAYVATTIANGDDFIQLRGNHDFPTAGEIESLKNAGVTINFYDSENASDFGDLLDDGVDYVLVNDPAMMMGAAVDYGIVPLLPIYRGDFNADGRVDTRDFDPFLQALVDREAFDAANPGFDADIYGDFDASGTFGLEDYAGFQKLLIKGRNFRGDYNFDGVVDMADYALWKTAYGLAGEASAVVPADGNGDGRVDAADFVVWRNNLGAGAPAPLLSARPAQVPEPATWLLALLVTGGVVVFLR